MNAILWWPTAYALALLALVCLETWWRGRGG